MKCEEVLKHLDDYAHGRCTKEQEQQIDEHMTECDSCTARLEEMALAEQALPSDLEVAKNSTKMIRRAKIKNRLSNFWTILLLFVCLFLLSNLVTGFYYSWNDKMDRARLVKQTHFQMTSNNMVLEPGVMETTSFMGVQYDFQVKKKVGKDFIYLTKQEPRLFFNRFTNVKFDEPVSLTDMYFVNRNASVDYNEEYVAAWKNLAKLPEGTVSEVAVTFNKGLSYNELFAVLANYDVELAWAGIETDRFEGGVNEVLYPGIDVIGFNEWSLFDLNDVEGAYSIEDGDGEHREEIVIDTLQFLIENESYVKQLNRLSGVKAFDPNDALAYIEEHGINLYGAILTGPTKELLKLQNEEVILYSSMGEVEFWNWDNW